MKPLAIPARGVTTWKVAIRWVVQARNGSNVARKWHRQHALPQICLHARLRQPGFLTLVSAASNTRRKSLIHDFLHTGSPVSPPILLQPHAPPRIPSPSSCSPLPVIEGASMRQTASAGKSGVYGALTFKRMFMKGVEGRRVLKNGGSTPSS